MEATMLTEIGIACFVAAAFVAAVAELVLAKAHSEKSEKARRLARMMLAGKTIRRV
jgi:hypothetical protein